MSGEDLERVLTPRLVCERIRADDADELAPILLDPRILEWLDPAGDPARWDAQRAAERYDRHWHECGFGQWLLRDRETGQVVGRGGLQFTDYVQPRQVEVAWTILPERWGQGLATEMAHAAVAAAFGPLGLSELVALTRPHNVASRRVMEKTGFAHQGDIVCDGLTHVLYRRTR